MLSSCGIRHQETIKINHSSFYGNKIGVAISETPQADLYFPGANCLLCIATAEAMNGSLSKYVESLDTSDLLNIHTKVISLLKKQGANVITINEKIKLDNFPEIDTEIKNKSHYDFSSLGQKYGIDKLLFINIRTIGGDRNYASYIPTGAPKAFIEGKVYLVDLKSNNYEWYKDITRAVPIKGKWDEPPHYPGMTNAYYQLLEETSDAIIGEIVR